MSLDATLADARALAESLMVDSCTVSLGSGEPVFNPATGQYETPSSDVYSGKCRIQSGGTQAANPEAGGAVFTVERVELQLPFGTDLRVGDIITVTASANPGLVNNRYRVTGLGEKTHATSSRYTVEVVS